MVTTNIVLKAYNDQQLANRALRAVKVDQHRYVYYFMDDRFACPYCGKTGKTEAGIRRHFEGCAEYQAKKDLYEPQQEVMEATVDNLIEPQKQSNEGEKQVSCC